ncbi:MAG: carbohydrate ABC transporter permease [Caldilineaceae bacterium]
MSTDVQTERMSDNLSWRQSRIQRTWLGHFLLHGLLIILSLLYMVPLLWVISTSFKAENKVFTFPIQWIPNPFVWQNYQQLLTLLEFSGIPAILFFFQNTLIIAVLSTLGTVISSVLVAYSFARLQWPERNFFFSLSLATMMLPGVVIIIPTFLLFRDLGWLDTLKPMIVPFWFAVQGFYVFLLRQFFLSLPIELEEAARIDGAGSLRILWQIIVPLSVPALITVTIFSFLQHYNEFLGPLLYLNTVENFPMALGLRMFQGRYGTNWPILMAATAVFIVPTIFVFLVAQRHFIRGIHLTGLAGR